MLISLIMLPLVLSSKYWANIIKGEYKYYDGYYDTLSEYLYITIIHPMAYPVLPILFAILVLIPLQLIKDWHYRKRGKRLAVWIKFLLLVGVIGFWVIFFHTFPHLL